MYFTSSAFVIVVLAAAGSVTPVCDFQAATLPCLEPVLAYAKGPEGQVLGPVFDLENVTETQLVSLCRLSRTFLQCLSGAVERCLPSEFTEMREFMTGVNSLMDVCDRPDLYRKTRLLIQCASVLNGTHGSKSLSCGNVSLREVMTKAKGLQGSNGTIKKGETGEIKWCCELQYYQTCRGTEVADKCGAETQEITDDMYHAFMAAFNGNGARCANCPARPPPTEDTNTVVDLKQFMATIGMVPRHELGP